MRDLGKGSDLWAKSLDRVACCCFFFFKKKKGIVPSPVCALLIFKVFPIDSIDKIFFFWFVRSFVENNNQVLDFGSISGILRPESKKKIITSDSQFGLYPFLARGTNYCIPLFMHSNVVWSQHSILFNFIKTFFFVKPWKQMWLFNRFTKDLVQERIISLSF